MIFRSFVAVALVSASGCDDGSGASVVSSNEGPSEEELHEFNSASEIQDWFKTPGDNGTWAIERGKLILRGSGDEFQMQVRGASTYLTDISLSVETEWQAGTNDHAYGILFRHSRSGGYMFGIAGGGAFVVGRWDRKGGLTGSFLDPIAIINWTSSSSIDVNGTNRLEVQTNGSLLQFSINGQRVAEISDRTYQKGVVGLFVGAQQEVAFDDFFIRKISDGIVSLGD